MGTGCRGPRDRVFRPLTCRASSRIDLPYMYAAARRVVYIYDKSIRGWRGGAGERRVCQSSGGYGTGQCGSFTGQPADLSARRASSRAEYGVRWPRMSR
jgi:hypothetical protein